MALTEVQARELTDQLETELYDRAPDAERLTDYYEGWQPLRFASSEFREYFADRYRDFSDNWVQVVADAPVERLEVTGFQLPGQQRADPDLYRVWQANGLDADSQLGFTGAVIASRSFVLVWGNPDDESTPEVTFEDASQCVVAYEPGSRRKRAAALKWWQDGSREFANLYMPDEVWKFERPLQRQTETLPLAMAQDSLREWQPRPSEPNPIPNPMGQVPMVELQNRPLLIRYPVSDVRSVVPLQDAVNILWANLFTAADFAAFPQRVVLGAQPPKTPVFNEAGDIIGEQAIDLGEFNVRRLLWLEDENAKTAEWTAAQLDNYITVIDEAVGHIAAQTRTPQHYLVGKMANLSSDALIAAEAGLVKRCQEKQLWFGQSLREVNVLIALAQGKKTKAKSIRSGRVLWKDTESRSQAQLTDALAKLKSIGFPFEWVAAQYGLTPEQVTEVLAMRETEARTDPVLAMLGTTEPHAGSAGEPSLPTQRRGRAARSPYVRASADGGTSAGPGTG